MYIVEIQRYTFLICNIYTTFLYISIAYMYKKLYLCIAKSNLFNPKMFSIMKKFFTLFLISVFSLSAVAVQPSRIYLIGDATSGGWSLDDATLMVPSGDGVFEWVGALNSGRMKFVTHHDWLPSYGPAADNTPMATGMVELTIRNTYEDGDNSFAVTAGRYSLRMDLTGATPQLTIADGTSLPDKGYTAVYPEIIYAIGSATAAGWTLDNAIAMSETDYNSGVYQAELALQTGELKFLKQKDWGKAYGATAANTPLTGAGEYGIMSIDDSNDLKFAVSLTSETSFDVTVNAATGKMTVADKQGMALENVIADGAMEVYDIQGRYVAASTADLPAGMYIVRTVSGSSKIVVY